MASQAVVCLHAQPANNVEPLINGRSLSRTLLVHVGMSLWSVLQNMVDERAAAVTSLMRALGRMKQLQKKPESHKRLQAPRTTLMVNKYT